MLKKQKCYDTKVNNLQDFTTLNSVQKAQEIASGHFFYVRVRVSPRLHFLEHQTESLDILQPFRSDLDSIEIRPDSNMVDTGNFHGMVYMVNHPFI